MAGYILKELNKADYINLNEFARILAGTDEDTKEVIRLKNYLLQLQSRYKFFPTHKLSEEFRRNYNKKDDLQKIWEWFNALKERGFKISSIKKKLLATNARYKKMIT